jgi:hypothetical protein
MTHLVKPPQKLFELRRYQEPTAFWLWILAGSLTIHLVLFVVLRSWMMRPTTPRSATSTPIEFVAVEIATNDVSAGQAIAPGTPTETATPGTAPAAPRSEATPAKTTAPPKEPATPAAIAAAPTPSPTSSPAPSPTPVPSPNAESPPSPTPSVSPSVAASPSPKPSPSPTPPPPPPDPSPPPPPPPPLLHLRPLHQPTPQRNPGRVAKFYPNPSLADRLFRKTRLRCKGVRG